MLRVVTDDDARAEMRFGLDEIVREGARRMLAVALEAEVGEYVTAFADERDEKGRRLVTRNGHVEPRSMSSTLWPRSPGSSATGPLRFDSALNLSGWHVCCSGRTTRRLSSLRLNPGFLVRRPS